MRGEDLTGQIFRDVPFLKDLMLAPLAENEVLAYRSMLFHRYIAEYARVRTITKWLKENVDRRL